MRNKLVAQAYVDGEGTKVSRLLFVNTVEKSSVQRDLCIAKRL